MAARERVSRRLQGSGLAGFLDHHGTLTPIVEDCAKAVLSEEMRQTIAALAECWTVAVVSGRDLATVCELGRLDTVLYAGSHGLEIGGPDGWHASPRPRDRR